MYGDHLERLRGIRKKYDPDDLMRHPPHVVTLSGALFLFLKCSECVNCEKQVEYSEQGLGGVGWFG